VVAGVTAAVQRGVWCSATATAVQQFSENSLIAIVSKEFQIGLYGVVEADWELFGDSWSEGFLGERL